MHRGTLWCLGCGRTGPEIAKWFNLSAAERAAVSASLPARLAAMGLPPGGDRERSRRPTRSRGAAQTSCGVAAACHRSNRPRRRPHRAARLEAQRGPRRSALAGVVDGAAHLGRALADLDVLAAITFGARHDRARGRAEAAFGRVVARHAGRGRRIERALAVGLHAARAAQTRVLRHADGDRIRSAERRVQARVARRALGDARLRAEVAVGPLDTQPVEAIAVADTGATEGALGLTQRRAGVGNATAQPGPAPRPAAPRCRAA
mgnify:CR=1 FL=1